MKMPSWMTIIGFVWPCVMGVACSANNGAVDAPPGSSSSGGGSSTVSEGTPVGSGLAVDAGSSDSGAGDAGFGSSGFGDAGFSDAGSGESHTVPPGNPPRRLGFLRGTDAVDHALTQAFTSYTESPTETTFAGLLEKSRQARAALQADPQAATTKLMNELNGLNGADDNGHAILFFLLAETGSPTALGHLRTLALTALPARQALGRVTEFGSDPRDHLATQRQMAVDQLGRAANMGHAAARRLLLEIVSKGDADVQSMAIQFVYLATPARWRAKREMAALLPPSKHYLLNTIVK